MNAAAATAPLEDEVAALARYEPEALADRWRIYARLREEAPVFEFGGTVFVSRYADVNAVLLEHERFHSGPLAAEQGKRGLPPGLTEQELAKVDEILDYQSRWMTASNGRRHADLRRLTTRVFSARAIAEMRGRIEELTEEMLEELGAHARVDFIHDFAYRLPLTIISEMLDIPVELREELHRIWVRMSRFLTGLEWKSRLPQDLDDVHAAYVEMGQVLREIMKRNREKDTTDLLSGLLAAREGESALFSEADLVSIVTQLLTAGHQTTQDLLGNALYSLFTRRDQWDALCAQPELAPDAVEEVLRYRSPAQLVARTTVEEVEVTGVPLPVGQSVTCLLGSANHDPAVFRDPETFDLRRPDAKAHLAFARGAHFCIGAALSRLEGTIVLRALAQRFPDADLVATDVEWIPHLQLLGLKALPVELGAYHA
jgi:cytochrome P450